MMGMFDWLLGAQQEAAPIVDGQPTWQSRGERLKRQQQMVEALRKQAQQERPGQMMRGSGGGGGRWQQLPSQFVGGNTPLSALAQAGAGYMAGRGQQAVNQGEPQLEADINNDWDQRVESQYGNPQATPGFNPMEQQPGPPPGMVTMQQQHAASTPGFGMGPSVTPNPAQTMPLPAGPAAPQGTPLDFPQGAGASMPSAPHPLAKALGASPELTPGDRRELIAGMANDNAALANNAAAMESIPQGGVFDTTTAQAYDEPMLPDEQYQQMKLTGDEEYDIAEMRKQGYTDKQIADLFTQAERTKRPYVQPVVPPVEAASMPSMAAGVEAGAPAMPQEDYMAQNRSDMLWAGKAIKNPLGRALAAKVWNEGAAVGPDMQLEREKGRLKMTLAQHKQALGLTDENDPSAVREFKYYMSLTPEKQREYRSLKRAQQLMNLQDRFAIVGPQGQITDEYAMGLKPGEEPELRGQQAAAIQAARAEEEKMRLKPARQFAVTVAAEKTKHAIDQVKQALDQVSIVSAGTASAGQKAIPGTPAFNLAAKLKNIEAILAFQEMNALKAASPQGSTGLGPIAVKEFEALANSLAAIDQGQSPKQLERELSTIIKRLENIQRYAITDYENSYGEQFAPANTGGERECRMGYCLKPGADPKLRSSWEKQ